MQLRHKQRTNELGWNLAAFTVASPADLNVMRSELKDYIDYFESDLIGFTTIRDLQEAATNFKVYDIPHRAMRESPEQNETTPTISECQAGDYACLQMLGDRLEVRLCRVLTLLSSS